MIRLIYSGVNWGTEPIEERDPETGERITGQQINLLDKQSGVLVHVPFSGDSLKNLIGELAAGLTDEQRRELAPKFNGGIILPGNGGASSRPRQQPQSGPQG